MSSVSGVVVWGDDLPSDDVIVCQKIDVAFVGVSVSGEGEPVESVEGSSEDYVPSVSLALIECLKLSDGDVVSHELGSLVCRIDLLVCETGKAEDGVHHGYFKVWVVGVCSGKDSGFFAGFSEWVVRTFLDPWCNHPLDDTLSHFDCGFNGPVMSWT